jgi:hypothetical protein
MTPKYDSMMAQRVIVLQVLDDEHPEPWTLVELEAESSDLDPRAMRDGLARLAAEGVVILDGEQVRASRCVRHLDQLEIVAI